MTTNECALTQPIQEGLQAGNEAGSGHRQARLCVWHGGMNLLGKADVWDNLIRVKDTQAAAELLEISFSSTKKLETPYYQHI
jgi:hypothetical protein